MEENPAESESGVVWCLEEAGLGWRSLLMSEVAKCAACFVCVGVCVFGKKGSRQLVIQNKNTLNYVPANVFWLSVRDSRAFGTERALN